MALSDERLRQWRQRREQRLDGLPWLRSTASGRNRVWYVADELLVLDDARGPAETALTEAGYRAADVHDEQVIPGVHRYRATGMDVPTLIGAVHRHAGGTGRTPVAAVNHVFLGTPFNQGGPYGPPTPATPASLSTAPEASPVNVAVVDTGVWRDSPVPDAFYLPGTVEYEDQTDVDHDGVLDGDVGHANFIAGVIIGHAPNVQISVLRVLDTFGLCTEAQLISTLARVPDEVAVVNLSLGGFSTDDQPPVGLAAALRQLLTGRDRVVVAAAGNDGSSGSPFWPAAFAGSDEPWAGQVVAVAAHDGGQICDWSNVGPWVTLAALGADVDSTFINHTTFPTGWARWNGTSFAAPRVAAAVVAGMAGGTGATEALGRTLKEASGHRYGDYLGLP